MADVRMTRNRWKAVAIAAKAVVDDVVETYAGLIENSAAVAAPYQYGLLQNSIAVAGAQGGASIARRRIVVGQFYGIYHEKGTHAEDGSQLIAPNPYLAPAVEYWRADYLTAVGMAVSGGW